MQLVNVALSCFFYFLFVAALLLVSLDEAIEVILNLLPLVIISLSIHQLFFHSLKVCRQAIYYAFMIFFLAVAANPIFDLPKFLIDIWVVNLIVADRNGELFLGSFDSHWGMLLRGLNDIIDGPMKGTVTIINFEIDRGSKLISFALLFTLGALPGNMAQGFNLLDGRPRDLKGITLQRGLAPELAVKGWLDWDLVNHRWHTSLLVREGFREEKGTV
jgi:hypothetical protein